MAIRGEWWIIDGTAIFSDAEIGDYNHSGVVIEHILSFHDIDHESFDQENYTDEQLLEMGVEQKEIDVIRDIIDPRDYAMENLGWKRIAGNEIQTHTLTSSDLRDLANGLFDINADIHTDEEFNIYVNSSKKYYNNVTYGDIESEQPERIIKNISAY